MQVQLEIGYWDKMKTKMKTISYIPMLVLDNVTKFEIKHAKNRRIKFYDLFLL